MIKLIPILILTSFIAISGKAQLYVEPVAGFQHDLNNPGFKLISTALQLAFKPSRQYELLLLLQRDWGLPLKSTDAAFSLNPALPLMVNAAKTICPSSVSLAIGHRIVVAGSKSLKKLSLILFTGLTFQHISVDYLYDKSNYTILNPDRTINRSGFYVAGGFEYMMMTKTGRMFVQLLIASPPTGKESGYPASFHAMAPVSLHLGYSIPVKAKRK
jgi:hypothetical protein